MTQARRNLLFAVAVLSLCIYCLACFLQTEVSWAPDDAWFAFTAIAPTFRPKADPGNEPTVNPDAATQLWVCDARTGELHKLDESDHPISRPEVFPDGKSILYLAADGGDAKRADVFRYDLAKNARQKLGALSFEAEETGFMVLFYGPRISPDGKEFVVTLMPYRRVGAALTLILDVETGRVKADVPGLHFASWMPDGASLFGYLEREKNEGKMDFVLVDRATLKVTPLGAGRLSEKAPVVAPSRLFFLSPRGTYFAHLREREGPKAAPKVVDLVVQLVKTGETVASTAGMAPVGWSKDETEFYVFSCEERTRERETEMHFGRLVRWNLRTGAKADVYEMPPLYASAPHVAGTLSHDASRLVLRVFVEEDTGVDMPREGAFVSKCVTDSGVLVLVDLTKKTATPIHPNDLSRYHLLLLHGNLTENLLKDGKIDEARKALAEWEQATKTQMAVFKVDAVREKCVRMMFDLYFNRLGDVVKASECLGDKGSAELRAKCLVRMGKIDEAIQLASTLPAKDGGKPRLLEDIEKFREENRTIDIERTNRFALDLFMEHAGNAGATDREVEACRAYLRRFPRGERAHVARAVVEKFDRWQPLRGAAKP